MLYFWLLFDGNQKKPDWKFCCFFFLLTPMFIWLIQEQHIVWTHKNKHKRKTKKLWERKCGSRTKREIWERDTHAAMERLAADSGLTSATSLAAWRAIFWLAACSPSCSSYTWRETWRILVEMWCTLVCRSVKDEQSDREKEKHGHWEFSY